VIMPYNIKRLEGNRKPNKKQKLVFKTIILPLVFKWWFSSC